LFEAVATQHQVTETVR